MHMFKNEFISGDKIRYSDGENDAMVDFGSNIEQYTRNNIEEPTRKPDIVGIVQMVNDAFQNNLSVFIGGSLTC